MIDFTMTFEYGNFLGSEYFKVGVPFKTHKQTAIYIFFQCFESCLEISSH